MEPPLDTTLTFLSFLLFCFFLPLSHRGLLFSEIARGWELHNNHICISQRCDCYRKFLDPGLAKTWPESNILFFFFFEATRIQYSKSTNGTELINPFVRNSRVLKILCLMKVPKYDKRERVYQCQFRKYF